jgi:hypothetical protein
MVAALVVNGERKREERNNRREIRANIRRR